MTSYTQSYAPQMTSYIQSYAPQTQSNKSSEAHGQQQQASYLLRVGPLRQERLHFAALFTAVRDIRRCTPYFLHRPRLDARISRRRAAAWKPKNFPAIPPCRLVPQRIPDSQDDVDLQPIYLPPHGPPTPKKKRKEKVRYRYV